MKFEKIQDIFFFGFLGISTVLFFWLMGSFAYTIFWAIFLTIIFYPMYKRFLKITRKRENLSAMLTIVLIFFIIILPISFTSYLVIDEIPQINKMIIESKKDQSVIDSIPFRDKIEDTLSKYNVSLGEMEKDAADSIQGSLTSFSKNILNFGKNTIGLIMNFFIMLYIMYFGLRDGKTYLLRLSKILPLGDRTERKLFNRFSSIIRSIFKGTLVVALIQGILAGVLFYAIGIHQGILIWTILMIIAAMIPAVGVALIVVPTILYMLFTSQILLAIILIIGLLFISTIDTVIRPHLIGKETEMPDMLITISILGGLSLLGTTGLVIGPVIAGFFLTMWKLFEEKYNSNLDDNC